MGEYPDKEYLELRAARKTEQLQQLVALYIQDTVQKPEPRRYSMLQTMVTRYLEPKVREKHVSSRDRLTEKHEQDRMKSANEINDCRSKNISPLPVAFDEGREKSMP